QIRLGSVTQILNGVSAFLLVMVLFQVLPVEIERLNSSNHGVKMEYRKDVLRQDGKSQLSYQPDIYYLIYDKYASNQSLSDYYDFDNSEFTESLTEKGFYIAEKSRANYPSTLFSLSSSLN